MNSTMWVPVRIESQPNMPVLQRHLYTSAIPDVYSCVAEKESICARLFL